MEPVSPHARTGWARVDAEITELRRHFRSATTEQDYRSVGNDCVAVTEALSRQVYDHAVHGKAGEGEPPVDKTKNRIGRFVEMAARGADSAESARSRLQSSSWLTLSNTGPLRCDETLESLLTV